MYLHRCTYNYYDTLFPFVNRKGKSAAALNERQAPFKAQRTLTGQGEFPYNDLADEQLPHGLRQ